MSNKPTIAPGNEMLNICHFGDCREIMQRLIDAGTKVQTCITSPPYWNLRDYGTGTWSGGDSHCDHVSHEIRTGKGMEELGKAWRGGGHKVSKKKVIQFQNVCKKCGAIKEDSQLGIERTPEEYVANMLEVFRLVGELLQDDGTLWLNLGDSYATSFKGGKKFSEGDKQANNKGSAIPKKKLNYGLKPKNLVGIPWRVALALQADGWYLRSDIIWYKPNPMPEPVTDRPTKSHEYIFLLTKNAKYYYDATAIREPCKDFQDDIRRKNQASKLHKRKPTEKISGLRQRGHAQPHTGFNSRWDHMTLAEQRANGANKRDVWTVATIPFNAEHFAVYPPKLIEPCILAGSRPGDTVLDPFFGFGTTGEVATRLGRDYIGIELNPEYQNLHDQRVMQMGLVL